MLDKPKGFSTSVHYSNSDFLLTPSVMNKRIGQVDNVNAGENERMDLDENNDRLSAQVKAIQVLSTVRAMQDEIQDINQQIEAENKKLQREDQLKDQIEEFKEVMITSPSSSSDLGDALR